MAKYLTIKAERLAIVHQTIMVTQSPQRRPAQLVAGRGAAVLKYPMANAYVVQQKIAERVNRLVAQSGRNGELPAVDHRSGRRRANSSHVTDRTSDLIE